MAESDEKKVNYLLFYEVINRLKGLKDQIDEQKEKLSTTNKILTDEEKWKGVSRNYYHEITLEQEKKLKEINEALGNLISDLSDTLNSFSLLDMLTAKKFEE